MSNATIGIIILSIDVLIAVGFTVYILCLMLLPMDD